MAKKLEIRHHVDETYGRADDAFQRMNRQIYSGMSTGTESRVAYEEIPVGDITPRAINQYSQTHIERLARSIKNTNNRLIHPIVVMMAEDLNPDGEVYKKYLEKGMDPKQMKYIIVSGERRYRAWMMLREEAIAANVASGMPKNLPTGFDTITANVLTSYEAKKEQVFYEDSNIEARRLTPFELFLHVKDVREILDTNEGKKEAEALGFKPGQKVNATGFAVDYLKKELGIDVKERDVKSALTVMNNGTDNVIDAVINEELTTRTALDIVSGNTPEKQDELLKDYLQTRTLAREEKKEELKERFTHKDAYKRIVKLEKGIRKNLEDIRKVRKDLGKDDLKTTDAVIAECEKLLSKIGDMRETLK